MNLKINGFNWIVSSKNEKEYTIVHANSDVPFQNGEGSQNLEFVLEGHVQLVVGEIYEAVMEDSIYNGRVQSRIVSLK